MISLPVLAVSLFAMLSSVSLASSEAPKDGKTTEEITKAVEALKGFGHVDSAQFNRFGRQVFAVWYCPFSGRGDCYLHAYYYDYEKAQWIRFADRLIEGSHDLSVEIPCGEDVVIFRRTDGEVALKESLAKFPVKIVQENKK